MSTIITRASKGAPLSWTEADTNLTNLNTDKLEASSLTPYLTSAAAASTYETQAHASSTYETQSHASATYPTKANNLSDLTNISTARTNLGLGTSATQASTSFASSGAVISNGNTMSTSKMLGRTTASTGAIEEITVGAGLTLSAGTLSSSSAIVLGTAVSSTSGSAINFTSLPSTVKRLVVMFKDFSTSGTNHILIQLGSSGVQSTGYSSAGSGHVAAIGPSIVSSTAGFLIYNDNAGDTRSGRLVIENMGSNNYVCSHNLITINSRLLNWWGAGHVTLSGVMDSVRITTVGGTDTFDSGSINILYE